jgi:hypothetical protein
MSERRLLVGVALAGLCALTLWLYAPGLHGPLVFDDYHALGGLLEADGLAVLVNLQALSHVLHQLGHSFTQDLLDLR